MQSITVRYEAPGASFGLADACVDDVRVGPPGEEDDQVLNGGFEEDCDRDGRPDFWEPIAGVPGTAILVRNDFYHAEGDYGLLLAGGSCTPQGAEQLIHLDADRSDYMVGLMAVSPARPQTLTVRLVDAGTNAVLQNVTAPIGSAWTPLSIALTAPGSGCGGPPPRIKLAVIPELCGPNLYLDAVQVVPRQAIAIDPPGPSPALSRPVAFRLASHPLPAGSRAGLSADLARSGHLAVRMVDARGRLLRPVLDAWRQAGSSPVPLPGSLPAGVYFLEARLDGRLEAREKIVLAP